MAVGLASRRRCLRLVRLSDTGSLEVSALVSRSAAKAAPPTRDPDRGPPPPKHFKWDFILLIVFLHDHVRSPRSSSCSSSSSGSSKETVQVTPRRKTRKRNCPIDKMCKQVGPVGGLLRSARLALLFVAVELSIPLSQVAPQALRVVPRALSCRPPRKVVAFVVAVTSCAVRSLRREEGGCIGHGNGPSSASSP